jgi:hypothetical protein
MALVRIRREGTGDNIEAITQPHGRPMIAGKIGTLPTADHTDLESSLPGNVAR